MEILFQLCKQHPWAYLLLFFRQTLWQNIHLLWQRSTRCTPPQARHPILFTIWFWVVCTSQDESTWHRCLLSFDGLSALLGSYPEVLVVHDIVFAHEPSYLPWLNRWYFKTGNAPVIEKASHIVTVSQFVKDDVCNQFVIDPAKVDVAYNAFAHSIYNTSLQILQVRLIFHILLYLGPLKEKNTLNILKGFEAYKQNDRHGFKLVLRADLCLNPVKR